MDKGQKIRWTCLGLALAVTLMAMAYPVEAPLEEVEERPVRAEVRTAAKSAIVVHVESSPEWLALEEDPFAAQAWVPPPVAVPAAALPIVRAVESIEISVPPPPPPLPFQFIGQMDTGSEHVIYLGRGEQIQMVKVGETLDAKYKLVNVSKSQLDFENVTTGVRQSMPIPASEADK